jgi:ubiquinone/menaquinone biosynthesis C-methylase UbiE
VYKKAEIKGASNRNELMVGSVTDIPFDDEAFDVVTCMGVIHEIGKLNSEVF